MLPFKVMAHASTVPPNAKLANRLLIGAHPVHKVTSTEWELVPNVKSNLLDVCPAT